MLYGEESGVNFGSGNGLLPDGTKPLLEPMLYYHEWGLKAYTRGAISQEMLKISILDMSLEITYLSFQSNLPGAN